VYQSLAEIATGFLAIRLITSRFMTATNTDSEAMDWGERFTRTVVAGIKAYREQREWKVQELADRCTELGYPMRRTTLSNLESGLRKSITLHELLIIAVALGVPPVMLVFPGLPTEPVEYRPGVTTESWPAATWFTGEYGEPSGLESGLHAPWRLLRGLRRLDELEKRQNRARLNKGKSRYRAEHLRAEGDDDTADLLMEQADDAENDLAAERVRLIEQLRDSGVDLGGSDRYRADA